MNEATTHVSIEKLDQVTVVRVEDDYLDDRNLSAVRAAASSAGAEQPDLPVALDLSQVPFMPSLSLGVLVQIAQLFKGRDQRLVVVGLHPEVREVIAITRLDRLFEIQDGVSDVG